VWEAFYLEPSFERTRNEKLIKINRDHYALMRLVELSDSFSNHCTDTLELTPS
jgi:hypothetical protein